MRVRRCYRRIYDQRGALTMARYAHEPTLWYAGSGFDALHCPGSNEKIRTAPPRWEKLLPGGVFFGRAAHSFINIKVRLQKQAVCRYCAALQEGKAGMRIAQAADLCLGARAVIRQAYAHGKQGEMVSLYKLNKFNYNHAHTLAASKGKQKAARCRKCSGAGRFPRPGGQHGGRTGC